MMTRSGQRLRCSTATSAETKPLAGLRNDERDTTQVSGTPVSSVNASPTCSAPSLAALASAGVATDNKPTEEVTNQVL